jgi:hypothetical protein
MKTSESKLKINEDGTLSIPSGTFSANEVDELLRQLAQARHEMNPPIPATCPEVPWTAAGGVRIGLGEQLTPDGFVTLALRHPGFGWLAYEIAPRDARTIATEITSLIRNVSFLDPNRGNGAVN